MPRVGIVLMLDKSFTKFWQSQFVPLIHEHLLRGGDGEWYIFLGNAGKRGERLIGRS